LLVVVGCIPNGRPELDDLRATLPAEGFGE